MLLKESQDSSKACEFIKLAADTGNCVLFLDISIWAECTRMVKASLRILRGFSLISFCIHWRGLSQAAFYLADLHSEG